MKALKQALILIPFLISLQLLSAQSWKEMMDDPQVNIYQVVQAAEAYFQTVDKEAKGSGWKNYQRWLHENEPKYYPSGDRSNMDPYFVSKAYQGFSGHSSSPLRTLFQGGWEELGPYYIGQVTGHYSLGLGRVESFYADPNDTMRIYLGSRSGGFWRTLDGGATWSGSTTDSLFATGVNTMAVSPFNPDSILINVRNSRNGTSHGIYRSVDAGDTWTVTPFNPSSVGWTGLGARGQIYKIAYHPTVRGVVFVGTSEGLFRSTDDMATWTAVWLTLDFTAIAFHPTNPNIIYAVSRNNDREIYVSTNGGLTFAISNRITGNSADIKISTTAACPNCVYVGSSDGIWKSIDNGLNFTLRSTPGLSNYGAFAVSDVDTSYVLFGNIDVNMSSNGGTTFNRATVWSQGNANYNTNNTYVHADIRGVRCENGVFWINTDGFLCKSKDNGVTWTRYEGQSIRENYNLGLSQSNHYRTISGSQDNGTSIKTETSWVEFYGADGMEGIIHPLNDDWMIGSVQNGIRRRTKNGGVGQDGVTPSGQSGYWIAPLFYDPNDQMTVYHIGDTIYKSTNFGTDWTMLGTPSFSGTITYATIAENNSQVMVVARSSRIEKSIDGGNTFTNIRGSLPNSSISDVAFDPNNDSVIVVTYSSYQNNNSKVYITHDQGLTWQNITYNLNNMPIRSVVIDHTDASTIYLGAEIGVYKKAMSATSWTLYNTDLPNMAVLELEVMYGSNTLRAATWGRGLWEYTLDGRKDYPSILTTTITDPPTDSKPQLSVNQYVTSTITYDDTLQDVYVEWSANSPIFGNMTSVISMTNTVDSTWVSDRPIPNQALGAKVYFKVYAVGNNGDTTETYKFMYRVGDFAYCASFGNMSYTTGVTLVDMNGLNNSTGKTQPYTDYSTTDSATVQVGSSYNISVNLDTDGNYSIFSKAWIDWNRDADFDDSGEEYDLGSAVNTANGPTSLSPLSITVPNYAIPGKTKMRVSAQYLTAPGPCGTFFDGEVEDYSIIVEKLTLADSVNVNICANDSVFLHGQWRNTTGIYYDTVAVSAGIDSVYISNLQTISTTFSTIRQTACNSYTWSANNTPYTASGTYQVILTNAAGCDSIATLNLTINQATASTDSASACDQYTWSVNNTTYAATGAYTAILTNTGGCDSTVTLNLTINNSSQSLETISACENYTWSANGTQYTSTGVYTEILTDTKGCDSTAVLNLTVNTINTAVTQLGFMLTADDPNATYQWLICPDMTPISGATNQTYAITTNGNYAVELTANGCTDTSACYAIVTVGIAENDFGPGFLVYPNPTEGAFSIDLGDKYASANVTLATVEGKVIQSQVFKDSRVVDLVIEEAAGMYVVVIEVGERRAVVRVVKE